MARGLYIGGKPVWATIPEINLLTGTPESVDLSAYLYNPRNRGITFSSVGSLPTGCSISGDYLNWNGNGTQSVTSVTIRAASNQYQADASASIDIALGGNSPPEWSQYIGPFNVPSNSTVGYVVANMGDYVTDPEDDTLTITMNGSLPSGLTYNSTTKQVTVTGSLTAGNAANVTFTADDGYVEEAITTLTLTGGSAGKAWTFGHPFKQGDVPSGSYITATGPTSFQAEVRNRWADGSVKFAVLSGIGGTSAELRTTAVAPNGTNVAEPSTTATVQFSSPATTVSLATARANGSMSWTKATAHKVREILGPVMSEFHYYSPVSGDNHLAVWWFVRAYVGGAVEVETVVENGWMKIASPTQKDYTVTVTVGGSTVYGPAALNHYHHTRWSRADWVGAAPGVTPSHDCTYLRATKIIPNYYAATPSSTRLNALTQTYTPFSVGIYASGGGTLGGAGYQQHIGLLQNWDALYVTSNGDSRAFNAVVAHSRCAQTWPVYYRDENTGKPLAYTDRPNIDAAGWGIDPVPTPGGSSPQSFGAGTQAHMPSAGVMAYLLEGRRSHMETAQFWVIRSHMQENPNSRLQWRSIPNQEDRGKTWHYRSTAHAALVSPDGDNLQTEFVNALGEQMKYLDTNWLNNNLGYVGNMYNPGLYGGLPNLVVGLFQAYFQSGVMGYVWDLAVVSDSTALAAMQRVRDFCYKLPVGLAGDGSGWCFQRAGQYSAAVGTYTSGGAENIVWDASWAAAYARNGYSGCTAGGALTGGNYPEATSYWGNFMPAISYAVDHAAPGASSGYARITGASNWPSTFVSAFNDDPVWGIVPR